MDVLPSPRGSQANPMRGAGLKSLLVMQPSGIPFTPHRRRPLVILGSRLLRFSGIGLHAPTTSQTEAGPLSRTPEKGSTVAWAASPGLYADGTQLYTLLF